jgi:hypothetical protein
MVVIVVLIVVTMLALGGFAFSELMLTERHATRVHGREIQARALVDSGFELMRVALEQPLEMREQSGGLYDNPEMFANVLAFEDTQRDEWGHFSIVNFDENEAGEQGPRFGLENESSRLNLAALLQWDSKQPGAGRQALLQLPGMTDEVADSILDWIDADDAPREFGAEVEFYSQRDPPYEPRNALPSSIEELLLVQGVTRSQLLGISGESGIQTSGVSASRASGTKPRGLDEASRPWVDYLTLYSKEKLVTPDGAPRVNVNSSRMAGLYYRLSRIFGAEKATFVIAYRQFGPYRGTEPSKGSFSGSLKINEPGPFQLSSVLDLIGAKVRITFDDDREPVVLASPFSDSPEALREDLPLMMSHLKLDEQQTRVGALNLRLASPEALRAIPGMDDYLFESLLEAREADFGASPAEEQDLSWLVIEGGVKIQELKRVLPYLTAGGDVYRAQVWGYYLNEPTALGAEVIVDAGTTPSRVILWRELPRRPHDLLVKGLGVESDTRSRR